ncbi:MAG: maleylpyruvate isomerase N-terminal domain-containing protein, partial [Sciscionella sp.]|nr:maleylpyruvate isomerase N-terminal domain-containing protein [Sciscionella sp.]
MDDDEVFAACTTLRRELADSLASLTPTQWQKPSLCAGWTVRVVVGHLLAALTGSLGEFAIA